MPKQVTVFIPQGYSLSFTTDAFTSGTYARLDNPGGEVYTPAVMAVSAVYSVGPFNEPRNYQFDYKGTDLVFSSVASGEYTAADDTALGLKADKASPTFSGTIAMASGAKHVLDKATGTEATNVVTVNAQCGAITTSALTTAASGSYVITLTNNKIVGSGSVILASIAGGTNTVKDISVEAVCTAANTATLTIYNNVLITTALNGTVIINFLVV